MLSVRLPLRCRCEVTLCGQQQRKVLTIPISGEPHVVGHRGRRNRSPDPANKKVLIITISGGLRVMGHRGRRNCGPYQANNKVLDMT